MGKENRFLREFENLIPPEEGDHYLDSGTVNLQDLLAQIAADRPLSCFTYKGSLTTAPYTEKVDWIILNHPIEASPRQIMEIEKREGYNARHVQSLYATGLGRRCPLRPPSLLVSLIFRLHLTVNHYCY